MLKISTVESHRLSDGTLVEISKVGRAYRYMHTSNDWLDAPELSGDLSKADAYAMLDAAMREDVLG